MARRGRSDTCGPRRSRLLQQFATEDGTLAAAQPIAPLSARSTRVAIARPNTSFSQRRALAEAGTRVSRPSSMSSARAVVADDLGVRAPLTSPMPTTSGVSSSASGVNASTSPDSQMTHVSLHPPLELSMSRFAMPLCVPRQTWNPAPSVEEATELIYQQARADAALKIAKFVGEDAQNTHCRTSQLGAMPAPSTLGSVPCPESPEWLETLASEFQSKPYNIADPAHRGMTLRQLSKVLSFFSVHSTRLHDAATHSPTHGIRLGMDFLNLYHVEHWLITPATKGRRCGEAGDCSFVELVADGRQTPEWFVSHWWGEPHFNFVRCIEAHVGLRSLSDCAPFWICAYANRQNSLDTEITRDPREASFYRAMKLASGILLVLDEENADFHTGPATPFSRIWCSFEQAVALTELHLKFDIAASRRHDVKILTDGLTLTEEQEKDRFAAWDTKQRREKLFPIQIIEAGLQVQLERAQASHALDRNRILNCLAQRPLDSEPLLCHPVYTEVNHRLRANFAIAVWRQALVRGIVRSLRLPDALSADRTRRGLTLCFKYLDKCTNEEAVMDLAQALPQSLETLSLDFTFCNQMDNRIVAGLFRPIGLADGMGSSLRKLVLNFEACFRIGDGALAAIGQALPCSLEDLDVNCKCCTTISSAGIAGLSVGVPPSLKSLRLEFYNCKTIGDDGIAALAEGIATATLAALSLRFDGCEKISRSGVASLTLALPTSLTVLELGFEGCGEIDDRTLAVFARGLPSSLKELPLSVFKLTLRGCGQVGSSGLMTIAQALPRRLVSFEADFSECASICDAGLAFLARNLPQCLTDMKLSFVACTKLGNAGLAALGRHVPSKLECLTLCFRGCNLLQDAGVQAFATCLKHLRTFDSDFTGTQVGSVRQTCNSSFERPDQLARRWQNDPVEASQVIAFNRPAEPACDAKPAKPATPAKPTAPPAAPIPSRART